MLKKIKTIAKNYKEKKANSQLQKLPKNVNKSHRQGMNIEDSEYLISNHLDKL